MHRTRKDVEDDFGDFPFFGGDDADSLDLGQTLGDAAMGSAERKLPARQRLEMRNEERSLREQLSDWDDYEEDLDLDL